MSDMSFSERYGPWAVIAGGSEGIGSAFAERLAKQGINLVLVARKSEPLEALAADVRKRFGVEVRTLSQDLMKPEALANVADAAKGCDVGLLIYNAGSDTSFGYILDRELTQHEGILMLNAFTPMRLTYHFAGALWYEAGKKGLDVISVVIPGVRTPAMVRLGAQFDENTSEPEQIADEALANLRNGPILDAGHCASIAPGLRGQPRGEVVRALGAASEKYSGGQ